MTHPQAEDIQRPLDAYLDAGLSPAARAAFEARLATDPALREEFARETRLRKAMGTMPAPHLAPAKAARMLRVARASAPIGFVRSRILRPALAMAASVAIVAVSVALLSNRPVAGPGANPPASLAAQSAPRAPVTIAMALGEERSLQLSIRSPSDLEHVNFKLELPEHVSLSGQPGVRELAWQGALRSGVNVLTLPLVGEREAQGPLVTSVSVRDFHRRLSVQLVVRPRGAPTRSDA